jgi:hypothetical protein
MEIWIFKKSEYLAEFIGRKSSGSLIFLNNRVWGVKKKSLFGSSENLSIEYYSNEVCDENWSAVYDSGDLGGHGMVVGLRCKVPYFDRRPEKYVKGYFPSRIFIYSINLNI